MKKLLVLMLLMAAAGEAYAAQTDTYQINVTIEGTNKDITIVESSTDTYTTAGAGAITYSSVTVTNTSTGWAATYQIKATATNWTFSDTESPGVNKCVLWAVVDSPASGSCTFDSSDVVYTGNYVDCTSSVFGDGSVENGVNVAASAQRSLLLKFQPPSSSGFSSDAIVVTMNVK